jgi:hypothetical protein
MRLPSLLGATLVPVLVLTQLALLWTQPALSPPRSKWQFDSQLAEIMRVQPGEVLSEDMGAVVQAGKTLWAEPFIITQMAEAGHWDQRPLLQMIREHKFSLIIKYGGVAGGLAQDQWSPVQWTPEEIMTITSNYHIRQLPASEKAVDGTFCLLEPNAPPGSPAPPRQ